RRRRFLRCGLLRGRLARRRLRGNGLLRFRLRRRSLLRRRLLFRRLLRGLPGSCHHCSPCLLVAIGGTRIEASRGACRYEPFIGARTRGIRPVVPTLMNTAREKRRPLAGTALSWKSIEEGRFP